MIFAAMSGISAAATITMGLVALPSMFKRGYDKQIVMGCISAGGALGILIPPSVAMVLYCMLVGISVGRVFAGGVFPGILLGGMFIIYIAVRCQLNPKLGPPIPVEERVPLRSTLPLFKALILPTIVIVSVLGSIFTGMATATESAAVGAFGAMICAAVSRKLDWPMVRESCIATLKLTTLVLWLMIGASWFSSVWTATGGPGFVTTAVQSLGVNRWVIMCGMQLILIFLGCVMETTGILMVTVPVFFPIIKALGFDPVWFGVLFIVNMEMGFLTPPFGLNLFYMKAIVPKEITMQDIYRSIVPFVGLQFIGLVICLLFPQIVLWLPDIMVR
jgi:tripartite ATP-independent transporter DctM subunit